MKTNYSEATVLWLEHQWPQWTCEFLESEGLEFLPTNKSGCRSRAPSLWYTFWVISWTWVVWRNFESVPGQDIYEHIRILHSNNPCQAQKIRRILNEDNRVALWLLKIRLSDVTRKESLNCCESPSTEMWISPDTLSGSHYIWSLFSNFLHFPCSLALSLSKFGMTWQKNGLNLFISHTL